MNNYKQLFSLPEDIHYINGAYMSPSLKQVTEAGKAMLLKKDNPTLITIDDFFTPVEKAKQSYGQMINSPAQQISIIPSASYGFANAFKNCITKGRKKAICVGGEFPSGYFTMKRWCEENNLQLEVIEKPASKDQRGKKWNREIVDAINNDTAVILIMSVHWMDGTRFDLEAIGEKCASLNVDFFVDGTQSVGAQKIDVQQCKISALINPAYKWLMGPYGIGLACYATSFNDGQPIEESWMNRANAADFSNLTDYDENYKPGAARYDIGESANFINLAMMNAGLDFLLDFGVEKIGAYTEALTQPLCHFLQEQQFWIEDKDFRAKHLFGFELPEGINLEKLKDTLGQRKVYLSFRKNSIRVSPNIYNTTDDMNALIDCLSQLQS